MIAWQIATFTYALIGVALTIMTVGGGAAERFSTDAYLYDFNTWTKDWALFERRYFRWAALRYIASTAAIIGVFMAALLTTIIMAATSFALEKLITALSGEAFHLFPNNFYYHFTIELYVFVSYVTTWTISVTRIAMVRSLFKAVWRNRRDSEKLSAHNKKD